MALLPEVVAGPGLRGAVGAGLREAVGAGLWGAVEVQPVQVEGWECFE